MNVTQHVIFLARCERIWPTLATHRGPEDELVPNITPHKGTGIGKWSRDELRQFLQFGELPDGEYAAGSMDPVIEGLNQLTPDDREALTDYLRALPPIENRIGD